MPETSRGVAGPASVTCLPYSSVMSRTRLADARPMTSNCADVELALLHQHARHRPAAGLHLRLDDRPAGRPAEVGLEAARQFGLVIEDFAAGR